MQIPATTQDAQAATQRCPGAGLGGEEGQEVAGFLGALRMVTLGHHQSLPSLGKGRI